MKKRQDSSSAQSESFIRTARELGCDEDPKAFEQALKTITKPKKDEEKRAARDARDPGDRR